TVQSVDTSLQLLMDACSDLKAGEDARIMHLEHARNIVRAARKVLLEPALDLLFRILPLREDDRDRRHHLGTRGKHWHGERTYPFHIFRCRDGKSADTDLLKQSDKPVPVRGRGFRIGGQSLRAQQLVAP